MQILKIFMPSEQKPSTVMQIKEIKTRKSVRVGIDRLADTLNTIVDSISTSSKNDRVGIDWLADTHSRFYINIDDIDWLADILASILE